MRRTRIVQVEARNVTQHELEGEVLFENVSVKLDFGKIMVVQGPPGSGTSVFLKIMAGLLKPSQGEVFYNEISITNSTLKEFVPIRLSTSFCFEDGGLISSMTLEENLKFSLHYHNGWRSTRSQKLFDELVDHFDMRRFLHRYPDAVSLGVRKIAGLIRSFLSEAQILFFDEPSLGIGSHANEALRYWIDRFRKQRKNDELLLMTCSDQKLLQGLDCEFWELNDRKLEKQNISNKAAI